MFRGRGRGGWGRGGGFGRGQQLPSDKFPEIEDLGKGEYNEKKKQLILWSRDLQNFWKASPYNYKPAKKVEKTDIQRYSDSALGATNKKRPLEHYIFMDADHLPGELSKAGGARVAKNVRWDVEFDDAFKKVEEKALGRAKEVAEMKKADEEDKEEEDEDEVRDDDEEVEVDENEDDDYGVGEDFDDDDDDYNTKNDGDDEPTY